ncbi:hypothetical protein K8F61_17175 [Microbacterium resistens]|uniref:Uncharacterized protein n=1 Tax=Microbacterium resistens TaxID=156977 RepID=A0ABY3RRB5_9MICO|nr:hypothetical protein [Microbacterium resistens]UGS26337.1 hypothetical protein K8F61_17175 [Microbacterium resistens]
MTARQGQRHTYAVLDEVALWTGSVDQYRTYIAQRRAALTAEVQDRYGVTLHPHPWRPHTVVVSRSDYDSLERQVIADPTLNAVGRGYYLYLGSELDVDVAPDWACDPLTLSLLRLRALLIDRPVRPIVRTLSRWLNRLT